MKLKKCIVGRPGYFDMVNKTEQNQKINKIKKKKKQKQKQRQQNKTI